MRKCAIADSRRTRPAPSRRLSSPSYTCCGTDWRRRARSAPRAWRRSGETPAIGPQSGVTARHRATRTARRAQINAASSHTTPVQSFSKGETSLKCSAIIAETSEITGVRITDRPCVRLSPNPFGTMNDIAHHQRHAVAQATCIFERTDPLRFAKSQAAPAHVVDRSCSVAQGAVARKEKHLTITRKCGHVFVRCRVHWEGDWVRPAVARRPRHEEVFAPRSPSSAECLKHHRTVGSYRW